jgi:hypothetical protein
VFSSTSSTSILVGSLSEANRVFNETRDRPICYNDYVLGIGQTLNASCSLFIESQLLLQEKIWPI